MYEYDEKGGKARDVQIEEAAMEVEEVREMGTVKVTFATWILTLCMEGLVDVIWMLIQRRR